MSHRLRLMPHRSIKRRYRHDESATKPQLVTVARRRPRLDRRRRRFQRRRDRARPTACWSSMLSNIRGWRASSARRCARDGEQAAADPDQHALPSRPHPRQRGVRRTADPGARQDLDRDGRGARAAHPAIAGPSPTFATKLRMLFGQNILELVPDGDPAQAWFKQRISLPDYDTVDDRAADARPSPISSRSTCRTRRVPPAITGGRRTATATSSSIWRRAKVVVPRRPAVPWPLPLAWRLRPRRLDRPAGARADARRRGRRRPGMACRPICSEVARVPRHADRAARRGRATPSRRGWSEDGGGARGPSAAIRRHQPLRGLDAARREGGVPLSRRGSYCCSFTPAISTAFAQTGISAAIIAANFSGPSPDRIDRRSPATARRTSGPCTARTISLASLSTIGFGVPAGASIPVQDTALKPG